MNETRERPTSDRVDGGRATAGSRGVGEGSRAGGSGERRDEPLVYDGIGAIPRGILARYFVGDAQRRAERFVGEVKDAAGAVRVLDSLRIELEALAQSAASSDGEFTAARVGIAMLAANVALEASRGTLGEEFVKFFQRAARDIDTRGKLEVFLSLFRAILAYATYSSTSGGRSLVDVYNNRSAGGKRHRQRGGGVRGAQDGDKRDPSLAEVGADDVVSDTNQS